MGIPGRAGRRPSVLGCGEVGKFCVACCHVEGMKALFGRITLDRIIRMVIYAGT